MNTDAGTPGRGPDDMGDDEQETEVAEWQQKLSEWRGLDLSPRLKAELRILKATLDASMDEANAAAAQLGLFN